MLQITIRPEAEEDLIKSWVYIAQDNPKAADSLYEAAQKTFGKLAGMPGMGAVYLSKNPQLTGLRFFPVKEFKKYFIFYRCSKSEIEIIRVLRAGRDFKNIL